MPRPDLDGPTTKTRVGNADWRSTTQAITWRGRNNLHDTTASFLCIAEEDGLAKARETMFEYSRKLRTPFPALLALYMDRGTAKDVLDEANRESTSGDAHTESLFYAHYYLGKYYEIIGDPENALAHVEIALQHRIPHFMFACAEADIARLASENEKTESGELP